MAENKKNIQEKLNTLKQTRKAEYENNKNIGAMIYNKVEFLGEGENTGKELFRVVEQYSVGENQTERREFFYEFDNNEPKLVAVRNDKTFGEIMPTSYPGEEGPQKDAWDAELLDIVQCLEEREEELKAIARELGISEEDIESLSEIDLEQKIEDKELENNEEKQDEQNEDEPPKISEKEAEKIGIKGNGMNSAKTNAQIDTKGNTLGKELNMEEYESIMVVHSYKLAQLKDAEEKNGKVNPMRFALVGKKKDGTIEIIPETKLRPYRGQNRQVTEINDRENVEVKNEECIFEVPNSNKRIAIDQKDPYGIPEIYYGKTDKENEGNVMQSVQDERDGTQRKDVEVRALFNSNKGEYQIDKMHNELKNKKEEENCEKTNYKDLDGNEHTAQHLHIESIVDYDGIKDAKFDIIAKVEGGCTNYEEVEELLDLTNNNLENYTEDPQKAIKLAIEERNANILQNSKEPEKVEELMRTTSIKNPKKAIEALEITEWNIEEAEEILGRYKGEENN